MKRLGEVLLPPPAAVVEGGASDLPCSDCGLPWVEDCMETYIRAEDCRAPVTRCPNYLRALAAQRLANAGIPPLYAEFTFDSFRTTGIKGGRQMAFNVQATSDNVNLWRVWRNNPTQCWPPQHLAGGGAGLLLWGLPGTGKSALAAVALAAFLERTSGSGRWLSLPQYLAQAQAAIDGKVERPRLAEYLLADLLVVDELGSRRRTPFVDDETYLLVSGRYDSGRPTIFTTNHPPAELEKHVGARVFSRLHEMCEPWLAFDQMEDYRKKKLTRKTAK